MYIYTIGNATYTCQYNMEIKTQPLNETSDIAQPFITLLFIVGFQNSNHHSHSTAGPGRSHGSHKPSLSSLSHLSCEPALCVSGLSWPPLSC